MCVGGWGAGTMMTTRRYANGLNKGQSGELSTRSSVKSSSACLCDFIERCMSAELPHGPRATCLSGT